MTSEPLTRMQYRTLEFVRSYNLETGISPTLSEVGKHFDVSRVTAHGHVRELERKGRIIRKPPHASRNLVIVGEGQTKEDLLSELERWREVGKFLKPIIDPIEDEGPGTSTWESEELIAAKRELAALLPQGEA